MELQDEKKRDFCGLKKSRIYFHEKNVEFKLLFKYIIIEHVTTSYFILWNVLNY
jgi:hypothetical protein